MPQPKYDRSALIAMFRLMSKREIDHVIDRAMHALSNCSAVINRRDEGIVRDSDLDLYDENTEFELYYFIVTEGLKQAKSSKKKLWMATTPHIQAKHRALQIQNQSTVDRRRGRIARAQAEQQRRRARRERYLAIQARAARFRAQREAYRAQGNRMAVVAADIEALTRPVEVAQQYHELLNTMPLTSGRVANTPLRPVASSQWATALASLQANHVVNRGTVQPSTAQRIVRR